jgi:arabinose-5-phosphate isomerase
VHGLESRATVYYSLMTNSAASKLKQPANSFEEDDVAYGRSIIREELVALAQVADLLDGRFAKAVEAILSAHAGSRIVISGMGKAGFVGMKLSATLSSIGFPSFFVHPADAIHGDLGRFTKNDIALLLSNSGETGEVLRLLPMLKQFGSRIIAITRSASSTLAQHSDITVEIGNFPEAGPLGLAPTTSTTVMMAVGDALAMTLVKRRGFTREEFAAFHPGGDLGRSLMLVSEIMRDDGSHCVVHESTITKKALHAITETKGRPGACAVVNDAGTLVGVFTDGNLRRCLDKEPDFLNLPIGTICSRDPITIRPNQLAHEACRIIQERQIDQLIVVNEQRIPVGLIDIQDLLAHGMIRPERS